MLMCLCWCGRHCPMLMCVCVGVVFTALCWCVFVLVWSSLFSVDVCLCWCGRHCFMLMCLCWCGRHCSLLMYVCVGVVFTALCWCVFVLVWSSLLSVDVCLCWCGRHCSLLMCVCVGVVVTALCWCVCVGVVVTALCWCMFVLVWSSLLYVDVCLCCCGRHCSMLMCVLCWCGRHWSLLMCVCVGVVVTALCWCVFVLVWSSLLYVDVGLCWCGRHCSLLMCVCVGVVVTALCWCVFVLVWSSLLYVDVCLCWYGRHCSVLVHLSLELVWSSLVLQFSVLIRVCCCGAGAEHPTALGGVRWCAGRVGATPQQQCRRQQPERARGHPPVSTTSQFTLPSPNPCNLLITPPDP